MEKHPRVKLHFTLTRSSWLNVIERWTGQPERNTLYHGCFTSVKDLRETIKIFIDSHNTHSAKPFRWSQAADAILASVDPARTSMILNS
ncbi:hypothetical protein DBV39_04870 [Orrella marina]|uniref:Transposase n=1 Tax=Orrella marina TaxID=2163011 RepID=A0A2R4XHE6_9BURK|nr:hypothetical protein DBV39_04870 [Orrella marina]